MNTLRNYTAAMLVAIFAFSVMPAISAEHKSWDSSAVLNLTDNLVSAARKLSKECRASPPKYLDEGTSGHLEFRYHVRHFLHVANELSDDLESGKSEKETAPMLNELSEIMVDLKKYAGGDRSKAWPLVSNAVSNVDGVLMELKVYYTPE